MADVECAAWVRKHLQHVIFGLGTILGGLVEVRIGSPTLLPLQLDLFMVVGLFGHSFKSTGGFLPAYRTRLVQSLEADGLGWGVLFFFVDAAFPLVAGVDGGQAFAREFEGAVLVRAGE